MIKLKVKTIIPSIVMIQVLNKPYKQSYRNLTGNIKFNGIL